MNIKIEKAIMFLWRYKLLIFFLLIMAVIVFCFLILANRISVLEAAFEAKLVEINLQFDWLTTNAQGADIQLLNRIKELKEAVRELFQLISNAWYQ